LTIRNKLRKHDYVKQCSLTYNTQRLEIPSGSYTFMQHKVVECFMS